ncbi:ABC transporter ATP-binding protein [Mycoplasmopsis hyopharyngis]|uniref:ABC transporter ATP-binding protein n=1 Tax=Mycoplasmopsis hyopharyngis TaxID=29558 RepID=UPI0038731102
MEKSNKKPKTSKTNIKNTLNKETEQQDLSFKINNQITEDIFVKEVEKPINLALKNKKTIKEAKKEIKTELTTQEQLKVQTNENEVEKDSQTLIKDVLNTNIENQISTQETIVIPEELKIFENEVSLDDSGYSRLFRKYLEYKIKPEPKSIRIMTGLSKPSFWKVFTKSCINLYNRTKYFFTMILPSWLRIKKNEKENRFAEFQKYIDNAQVEYIFNKPRKVVAEVNDVYLSFANPANPKEKSIVLRGPSFKTYEGCIHAIIGESGSGKSVITSLLYGLTGSNAIFESGTVKLYGMEVQHFTLKDWENSKLRGRIVSAVFQNPMSILDPTMKVGEQIIEGMLINKIVKNRKEAKQEAIKYLQLTKINNPEKVMTLYPHELSGGMIQRIALAAIVSLKPKLLIMDEPTTALDPTVQALVLDIVRELQSAFKISIIFITHDLGVVASIADYINIMYAGQIIEAGTKEEILTHPMHPYTWGLIASMPDFNTGEKLHVIEGAVPSNLNNIVGEAFAIRNEYALEIDFEKESSFYQISPTHYVKSELLNEHSPKVKPPKVIQKLWNKYEQKLNQLYGKQWYVKEEIFNYYQNRCTLHNQEVDKLIEESQQQESQEETKGEANV